MGHDQRQRVLVLRLHMDEVDVHAVDLGRELGQGVELRLGLAPVVVGLPVARELLHRRELHALGAIFDELLAGPARRGDAAAQLDELLFRHVDVEGAYCGLFPNWCGHGGPLSIEGAFKGNDRTIPLGEEDVCATEHFVPRGTAAALRGAYGG